MTQETLAYVIADLRDRAEFGLKKYGTRLGTNTEADMLQMAYEEALDLAMYLKTEINRKKQERRTNRTMPLTIGDYT